ncbi:MAG: LysR family transcriptional regulator [Deltaproteobacteria bacterium]|nr:LysR family transcriptional regulator [Deltaproteobacteria bacterium]
MDIDYLETFLAVARAASFTEAAAVRHLTQPAVSRQVQRLEEDLGVKLFQQAGRRVRLTAQGELLLEEGARLIGQVRSVRAALEDLGQLRRGEIRVGASSTPGTYMLPPTLAAFHGEYPGVDLRYEIANSRAIEGKVVRGELDLGFVGERVDTNHTTTEVFANDAICLIAAPTHRLARRRAVPIQEILDDQYIAREEGSATRRAFDQWLVRRGASWQPYLELDSVEAVKHTVAAGLGIAAVSRIAVDWEVQAGRLAVVKAQNMQISRELFVLYRKDVRLSAAAGVFLSMVRNATQKPSP